MNPSQHNNVSHLNYLPVNVLSNQIVNDIIQVISNNVRSAIPSSSSSPAINSTIANNKVTGARKSELCRHFLAKRCFKGNKCRFSHHDVKYNNSNSHIYPHNHPRPHHPQPQPPHHQLQQQYSNRPPHHQQQHSEIDEELPPSYVEATTMGSSSSSSSPSSSSPSSSSSSSILSSPSSASSSSSKNISSFERFFSTAFHELRSNGIAKAQENVNVQQQQRPKYSLSSSRLTIAPLSYTKSSSSSSSTTASYVELTDLPMDCAYVIDSCNNSSASSSLANIVYRDVYGNIIQDWKLFMNDVHQGLFNNIDTPILQKSADLVTAKTNIVPNQLCSVYIGRYDLQDPANDPGNSRSYFYHYTTHAQILGKKMIISPAGDGFTNESSDIQDYRHTNDTNLINQFENDPSDHVPNVRFIEILYNCLVYVFIVANQPIVGGQPIYIDYGPEFHMPEKSISAPPPNNIKSSSQKVKKKSRQTHSSDDEGTNEDKENGPVKKKPRKLQSYVVSKINDIKLDASTGELLYQTFWIGYDEPTLEPARSFKSSQELLQEFQKNYFIELTTRASRGVPVNSAELKFYTRFKKQFDAFNMIKKKHL